jgi:hypothetical protein
MLQKTLVLLTGLLMSASMAMAAATAPKFNKPVMAGKGELSKSNNQSLAFDGTTIYATFDNDGARVVASGNNGATWDLSRTFPGAADNQSERIAVSNDPTIPGKKIVHAAWKGSDALGEAVFYAFKANRPSQTGWSTPIKALDLSSNGGQMGLGVNLAASGSGAVHITNGRQYVTATSPGSAFSTPIEIPILGPEHETTRSVLNIDSANNLYVVHISHDTRTFSLTKKAADATAWSTPVEIYVAPASLSGNFEFVALDANNIYLAAYEGSTDGSKGNLLLFVSTNGGATWTKRTVVADTPHGDGENNPTLTVSSAKIITYASEIYDTDGLNPVINVWRSNDNGATWSTATTIKGGSSPHLTLDVSGKVNVLVKDGNGNLLWTKEK